MPHDDITQFVRRRTALVGGVVLIVVSVMGIVAVRCDAAPSRTKPEDAVSTDEHVTEFTITDGDKCDTVRSGRLKLSGTLKIRFAGRILLHENTEAVLYGKGVSSLSGKFDRVEVPKGWLYDLKYDYEKPQVVIKNFRPDHVPAFPGAEGFGKFAVGG